MIAVSHRDLGKRFGGGAGVAQVAHGRHAKPLRWCGPPPVHVELVVPIGARRWHRSAGGLAAHAPAGPAIHGAKDDDDLAVAALQ